MEYRAIDDFLTGVKSLAPKCGQIRPNSCKVRKLASGQVHDGARRTFCGI